MTSEFVVPSYRSDRKLTRASLNPSRERPLFPSSPGPRHPGSCWSSSRASLLYPRHQVSSPPTQPPAPSCPPGAKVFFLLFYCLFRNNFKHAEKLQEEYDESHARIAHIHQLLAFCHVCWLTSLSDHVPSPLLTCAFPSPAGGSACSPAHGHTWLGPSRLLASPVLLPVPSVTRFMAFPWPSRAPICHFICMAHPSLLLFIQLWLSHCHLPMIPLLMELPRQPLSVMSPVLFSLRPLLGLKTIMHTLSTYSFLHPWVALWVGLCTSASYP